MNKKTVSISLPQIEGVKLKSATVDLEKGVVVAEYGEEDEQEDIDKDISEIVVNENTARDYLDIDIFDETFDYRLDALHQLITIAKAWNKFDKFEADWTNPGQYKWHPVFGLKNGKIEFLDAGTARLLLNPYISDFSFKTKERAEQFGKQFIDLFRIVLTN